MNFRKNLTKLVVVSAMLCLGAGTGSAAFITVTSASFIYNGAPGNVSPSGQSGFNSGTVNISGSSFSHSGAYTSTGGELSLSGNLSGTIVGGASLSISTVLSHVTMVDEPTYNMSPYGNSGYSVDIGFTVDVTGAYTFGGSLNALANSSIAAPSGFFPFSGIGGFVDIVGVGGLGPNGTGNFPEPIAPSVAFSFSGTHFLTAGTAYQISFINYMYEGGAGVGTITTSSGWDLTLTGPPSPVPEVSSSLLAALGVVGFGLRRKR